MIFLMLFFSCMVILHSSSNHSSFLFPVFSPSDYFTTFTFKFLILFLSICTSCSPSVSSNFSFIFCWYKLRFSSFFSLSIFHPFLFLPWFLSALDSVSLNVTFTKKWLESQLVLRHNLTSVILDAFLLFITTWSMVNLTDHVSSGAHPCSVVYLFTFKVGTFNYHIISGCKLSQSFSIFTCRFV